MNSVVLLGPPGSGKGTVAEVLVDRGYRHVSTGDLLREQISLETDLGLRAKKLMEKGQFVPDDVVVDMIHNLLREEGPGGKFLFDGFPRTLVQAEKLDELVASLEGQIDQVVLLECPDEVIVERLSGRRSCPQCKTVYHVVYNPPKSYGVCDAEGTTLIHRDDDNAETIIERLHVYADRTAPLISYYKAKNLVQPVDATESIEDVRGAVLERVG